MTLRFFVFSAFTEDFAETHQRLYNAIFEVELLEHPQRVFKVCYRLIELM